MKIENQVCTLEQAKKLKELLRSYDTNFYWVELPEGSHLATKKNVDDNLAFDRSLGDNMVAINRVATAWKSIHPAYTLSELAIMLDSYFEVYKYKHADTWVDGSRNSIEYSTPAQAASSRLINLIEDGELSSEEVNNRLIASPNNTGGGIE